MKTVRELYDIALASFINQRGGMDAFRDFLEAKCRFGELTRKQKHDFLEAAGRAMEKHGYEEPEEEQMTATVTDKGKAQNFTAKEVGERIGCSANTVYRMVKRNEIPYKAIGRRVLFDADDLEKWTGSRAFKEWQRKFTPKIKGKTRDITEIRKDENGVEHKVYLADPQREYRRQEAAALLGITDGHLDDLAREGKIRRRKDARGSYFWGDDLIKYRERHPRRGGTRRKSPSLFEN